MKIKFWLFVILAVGCLLPLWGQSSGGNIFIVPDNLKDNVAFWKKIYTEVSLKDGLVHDRDYPLIIYKKITIGNLRGRKRRQTIRSHMNTVKQWLRNISRTPEARWSADEKRTAALFRKYADLKKVKTAHQRLRFQQGQKERYKEGLEISGAYLPYIRRVFKQYNIPERIIYLPHVESSFNIKAYSRVGAAGMWQFMRRTARLFMKVNYKVDERRDPFKSTVAAAKLLTTNFKAVKAWPLAITAYNHGLVSIKRAVRQTGTRDIGVIVEKYKNRRFRFASKNFYSCFLAASEIAMNADKYFPNIKYHRPFSFVEIPLKSYIRTSVLIKHLGISEKELARLNPSLRPTVFRRRMTVPRGFLLRIPSTISAKDAAARINGIPGTLKKITSDDYYYYSVRRGDTLYRISRRYRVSVDTLLASNNISRKNRIYIGQVLRIPGKPAAKKSTPKASPAPKPTTVPAAPTIKRPPAAKPKAAAGEKGAETMPAQGKNNGKPTDSSFDATLYHLDISYYPHKGTAVIRVAVGETLGHYADWLGVNTYRIRRLNHGRRSIRVNQKLILPMKENKLAPFKARRLEYHMAREEDFYSQYQVTGMTERKIKYGETVWSICRDEDIPLWLFKKYNRRRDGKSLKKNTLIYLPSVKEVEKSG